MATPRRPKKRPHPVAKALRTLFKPKRVRDRKKYHRATERRVKRGD